ncbi:MAG: cupin domain-containing protein [Candidatus Dormibacteraeota bacterium]|nr:cupin domain-containing protein [Candidatus Dormibacteraeota bacterium]
MAGVQRLDFGSADETRQFADGKGKLEVVKSEAGPIGKATFQPGWRWSEHVKPIVGTDSCQVAHLAYVASGQMTVRSDDGTETNVGPGDVFVATPGHDAWVVGDEPCVQVDFQGAASYAKAPA